LGNVYVLDCTHSYYVLEKLDKWDVAVIAVIGAMSLQLLKTLNPPLFWIAFGIILWIAIYKLIRRYG